MNKAHVSVSERLKSYMSMYNVKQVEILEKCKPLCEQHHITLTKGMLSQYISGYIKPRENKIYILAKALNVNEAWLMGYDVPMERTDDINELISKEKDLLMQKVSSIKDDEQARLLLTLFDLPIDKLKALNNLLDNIR